MRLLQLYLFLQNRFTLETDCPPSHIPALTPFPVFVLTRLLISHILLQVRNPLLLVSAPPCFVSSLPFTHRFSLGSSQSSHLPAASSASGSFLRPALISFSARKVIFSFPGLLPFAGSFFPTLILQRGLVEETFTRDRGSDLLPLF